ncbi:MAG: GNAT family N-acetyltransferase [Thermodesulfobacteriota bacterium]
MDEAAYSFPATPSERHLAELHALYQNEWWTRGRTLDETRRAVEGSDVVVAICDHATGRLLAFARVLTDGVFKALVLDVIVAPERRGEQLGRRLMDAVLAHPDVAGVAHVELYCRPEMVPFYERYGFSTDVAGVLLMRRAAR